MKKTKLVRKLIKEEVVIDILCNNCGQTCDNKPGLIGKSFEGLIEAKVRGGYGSLLGDETEYTFSICETCLKKLFQGFAIPPEIKDY
jgi:hypothetical protein